MGKVLVVSSDGHATARMPDYRDYLDARFRSDFDEFCVEYAKHGSRNFDPPALRIRTDEDVVKEWVETMFDSGRVDGNWNPARRLAELEKEGISAEVLFPDFGLPFELYSPFLAASLRSSTRTREGEYELASNHAYVRWLSDFCASAPERFVGFAPVSFDDPEQAISDIYMVKNAGMRGIVLPKFTAEYPLYHERYDSIWSACVDLDLIVQAHPGISSTLKQYPQFARTSSAACDFPVHHDMQAFFSRQVFNHFIWGGVLERHPALTLVLTELGSGWILGVLAEMEHRYEHSFLRRDVRETVRHNPREYFERQVHLGSSIFSRAEVDARHEIGIHKMMIGMDFPHHEGTFGMGTGEYLRQTFGAVAVPEAEARQMLGLNAVKVFGLDRSGLEQVAARVGPDAAEILSPPASDDVVRGDVHKPLSFLTG
jgi:predicted TIM-barrel fold metal-dependent hydrolase